MRGPTWPGRVVAAVAVVASLSIVAAGSGGTTKSSAKTTIKFGVQVPLTGIYSAVGSSMLNGIKLQVAQVNAAGGIAGHNLQAVVLDDGSSNPATAAANAAHLADLKVPGTVHAVGGNTLAAMPSDERAGMLSFVTTSWDVITAAGGKFTPETFFVQIDAKTTVGPLMACYAAKGFKAKTAAWISGDNDPSGQAFLSGAEAWLKKYNVKLVKSVGVTQPITDATAQIRSMLDAKPDVIINSISGAGGVVVMKNLQSLNNKLPVIGGVVWAQTGALKDIGSAANGVVMPNNIDGAYPRPYQKAFVTAYRAKFGTIPDTFSAAGYDSVKLLAVALKKYPTARARNGLKLARYLETQKVPGVMAKTLKFAKFNADNAQTHSALHKEDLSFFKIDNGSSGTAPTVTPTATQPAC
jgi:branched-chain amino acid transport system substrate-binding protein